MEQHRDEMEVAKTGSNLRWANQLMQQDTHHAAAAAQMQMQMHEVDETVKILRTRTRAAWAGVNTFVRLSMLFDETSAAAHTHR